MFKISSRVLVFSISRTAIIKGSKDAKNVIQQKGIAWFNNLLPIANNNKKLYSTIRQPSFLDEHETFLSYFPEIVKDLTEGCSAEISPVVAKHFGNALTYNAFGGKHHRGLFTLCSYKMIENTQHLSLENIKLACILGWCIELLQATAIILDDIMDGSETRRGMICWYKRPEVRLIAINDGLMVYNGIYSLLRKHLSCHKSYVPITEVFLDTWRKTVFGQSLDILSTIGETRPGTLTIDTYSSIVLNKTTPYSITLPITLALHLAGKYDNEIHNQIIPILNDIGMLYQVKDDFLDCFGDFEEMGKEGSDVRTGKCSWLAVTALQLASPAQRTIFEKCYGRPEIELQEEIYSLYKQIGLPRMHAIYEAKLVDSIKSGLSKIPNERFPRGILLMLLEPLALLESHVKGS